MPTILWIPIGLVVVSVLLGAYVGANSRTGTAGTGAIVGLSLALMSSFPLLSIGLTDL